ncbi:MAG: hypothetical protein JXA21_07925 [Anaerolineae bacterium]|nr:hypothetical protein [Anaerolineae bacterium]
MLTQDQLDRLNAAIRQNDETSNPLAKLIQASQCAGISLQDVLEHLIVQALENAYRSETIPTHE